LHRPSGATVISLVALFFALSGTAVAATGGNFILGKSNTAASVSSLTNSNGTALSLSSTSTAPPLTVSNSVQVPDLNASMLGGIAASKFVQGGGQSRSFGIDVPVPTTGFTTQKLLSLGTFGTLNGLCLSGSPETAEVTLMTGSHTMDRFSAGIENFSTVSVGNGTVTPNTNWLEAQVDTNNVNAVWEQQMIRYTTGSGASLTTHVATVNIMVDVTSTDCDFDASAIIGPGVTGP
jgi:hypothetical protein